MIISFRTCQKGGTIILMALALPMMVTLMAVLVDFGRIYAVQSKAQNASDAALLGAVATFSAAPLEQEVTRLFNANYPSGYMGSSVSEIVTTAISSSVYESTYTVTVPTVVAGIFSNETTTIQMLSQVTRGFDENLANRLELAMVLDNTGSMQGSKIQALRQASVDLTNILFGGSATLNKLRVSVIPYDIAVNVGVNREDWIQQPSLEKFRTVVNRFGTGGAFNRRTDHLCGPYPWEQCWEAYWSRCEPSCGQICNPETGVCRTECSDCSDFVSTFVPAGCRTLQTTECTPNGYNDISDEPPTSGEQWKFRLPLERSLNESGLEIYSLWQTTIGPIVFASNVKSDLISAFNNMSVAGGTRINVGLMWGWFTLSPRWQGLWDPARPELPYSPAPNLQKAIILMTDGRNIFNGDDQVTADLCTAIKAQGIVIYVVGFGADVNEQLLRGCATNPQYYWFAPTEQDLRRVFRTIGDDLLFNTVRLSK